MPDYYDTKCTHCGHAEKRYRNVKHCRKCGNLITRVFEPDKKDIEIAKLRQLVSDLKEDGAQLADWLSDYAIFDTSTDKYCVQILKDHAALMERIEKAGI